MADERYKAACEKAIEEVDALLAKVAEKKKFANLLAQMADLAAPYEDIEAPAVGAAGTLRADQFANHATPSAAARAFLEFRGQAKGAASLEVIAEALEQGGFAFGSMKNDPRGGLRIALGKDGQVRRLANGTYGLWDWYPNAKRPAATTAGKRALPDLRSPIHVIQGQFEEDGDEPTADEEVEKST